MIRFIFLLRLRYKFLDSVSRIHRFLYQILHLHHITDIHICAHKHSTYLINKTCMYMFMCGYVPCTYIISCMIHICLQCISSFNTVNKVQRGAKSSASKLQFRAQWLFYIFGKRWSFNNDQWLEKQYLLCDFITEHGVVCKTRWLYSVDLLC